MKVILQKDIKNIGRKFDVKNVKDGYARHYLIPQKLVKVATPQAMSSLNKEIKRGLEEEKKLMERLKIMASKIKEEHLKFKVKHSDGKAYGSIGEKDIEDALEKLDYSYLKAVLASSLKTLGDYEAKIVFETGIESKIKVSLLPEE